MTEPRLTRRQMVHSLVSGSLVFPAIVQQLLADSGSGLTPKVPHFAGKAKSVIFLYMSGGASHVDTFDYKPKLAEAADRGASGPESRKLLPSPWAFRPRGECGLYISDLFPHVGACADELCVIRSMRGDHADHFQATLGIHTGSVSVPRPSLGSWVSYGLGAANRNLPSFVVLAPGLPYAGTQVWSANFLPAQHAGTYVVPGSEPAPHLRRRTPSEEIQRLELNLLERFNRNHLQQRGEDSELAARLHSYETAFGMQMEMPEALDLSQETDATHQLYGLERGSMKGFAWQCLVARRLIERGVRFVELIDSDALSSGNWDAHADIKSHEPLARNVDQAAAGLIKDLKARGLLDETLVVWTTEFGRSPHSQQGRGRDHHPHAFSSWLAGGGVKGGITHGRTDDIGAKVAENECHVHDFHATILHLLGFDHTKLTYRHAGRDFRLTDVHGQIVSEILR